MSAFRNIMIGAATLISIGWLSNNTGGLSNSKPVPKTAAQIEHDRQWDHDFQILWNVKENAVNLNLAVSSDISGWNQSVDLTLGTNNQFTADATANAICNNANLHLFDRKWKVRVYLVNGTIGAQCKFSN